MFVELHYITLHYRIAGNFHQGKFSPKPDAKYCGKNSQIYFCVCPPVQISFNAQLSLNGGKEP